jgi:hypothetical protein
MGSELDPGYIAHRPRTIHVDTSSQDSRKSPSYFSQLCVQSFLFGHKLQCLIEKSFFFGFADVLGVVSRRISAGSSDSGHFTIFLI